MKTLVIVGFLLVGVSGQVFSMGHPHNMFAARKQMRTKTSASIYKAKSSASLNCQRAVAVDITKTSFSERLVAAIGHMSPVRFF